LRASTRVSQTLTDDNHTSLFRTSNAT